MTSTSLIGGSRLWSWDYARATTDSTPTCSGRWSWHHHRPATAVLKTRRPNIYTAEMPVSADGKNKRVANGSPCSDTPNSTTARRNWRRRPHSSCRLDSQCSGDREDEEEIESNDSIPSLVRVSAKSIFHCCVPLFTAKFHGFIELFAPGGWKTEPLS